MVESDNGKHTVHCSTLYFSLSNVSYFLKKPNIGYLYRCWDLIHQEDSSTHIIINYFLQNARKLCLPQ